MVSGCNMLVGLFVLFSLFHNECPLECALNVFIIICFYDILQTLVV